MPQNNHRPVDEPMFVKLDRALKAITRRSVEERVDLLIRAGVVPKSRRARAIANMKANLAKQAKRRSRTRHAKPA